MPPRLALSDTASSRHAPRSRLEPRLFLASALATLLASILLVLASSCALPRYGTFEFTEPDAGPAGECTQADQCPGKFEDCRAPSCDNGTCGTALQPINTPCDDDGGKVCNGQGDCVECTESTHCATGEICQVNLCVPASCGDGTENSGETDVDCGGPCAPCENGQGCEDAADCVSGYCANDVCAPCTVTGDCQETAWCDAGICVPDKDNGDICTADEQCASGFCPADDGACCNQACEDECMACIPGFTGLELGVCGAVLDGEDPDAECLDQGAASCGPDGYGCYQGACRLYTATTQCVAPTCTNGVRHWTLCDGLGLCNDEKTQDCSPYQCNGTACRTSCSDDSHCLSGSYCCLPGSVCDPEDYNTCLSLGNPGNPCGGNNECNSGFCVDARCCESACTGVCKACSNSKTGLADGLCRSIPTGADPDDDCTDGACYRIDNTTGECRYNLGHVCNATVKCLQNSCVDGYCCENECTALCRSCDGSESIGSNGLCRPIISATDPDDECLGSPADPCGPNGDGCDGAGQCILASSGDPCGDLTGSCSNGDYYPPDGCNGSGTCIQSTGEDCGLYPCDPATGCATACGGDGECPADHFCNGSQQCVPDLARGNDCNRASQCISGFCTDGVCCNNECTGLCRSCDGDYNEVGDGTCGDVTAGLDPDGDCSFDCAAGATCEADNGTSCSNGSECGSGFCPVQDLVCCNVACDGKCEACTNAKTGAADGTCAPIPDGQDPDEECPGGHTCVDGGLCSNET